jgi:hypothetical protein
MEWTDRARLDYLRANAAWDQYLKAALETLCNDHEVDANYITVRDNTLFFETIELPNLTFLINLANEIGTPIDRVSETHTTSDGCPTCGYGNDTIFSWTYPTKV